MFKHKTHLIYLGLDFIAALAVTFFFYFEYFLDYFQGNGVTSYEIMAIGIYGICLGIVLTLSFMLLGVYNMITRNYGLYESLRMFFICLAVNLASLIALYVIPEEVLPRPNTVPFISWFFTTAMLTLITVGIRAFTRIVKLTKSSIRDARNIRSKAIIIGAGSAAKIIVEESRVNENFDCRIVAFVDDDPKKINNTFSGLPVRGPIENISEFVKEFEAEEVIIAIANLSEQRLHEILSLLDDVNVRVRRMPLLSEMSGPNDHRVIDVDLDELLCRKPVELDNKEVFDLLNGKTVMVTGAGGSIGSELTRQIFRTHPKTLVLFDIYENSTYDIQQELVREMRTNNITDIKLVTLIGSTYNEKRVEQVLKKYHPDFIYHAAAYKHVPLMEDSPSEAIRTNVIGTYNVARLADKYGVKKMVLVSTDKAVRPTNTMGATKRFAETIIQYFAEKSKTTAYAAVRFGNVLGSNGSVVPLFKKQIEKGGPITITHKDIIRYFMTIPEAVCLILQSSLYATGGEIFILDMGKPVKILTLAEKLIRQAGYIPYKDIDIVETGLRQGEKLFEELLLDKKTQNKTANEKIFIEEKEAIYPIEDEIKEIVQVFDFEDNDDIKKMLAKIITTYTITNN